MSSVGSLFVTVPMNGAEELLKMFIHFNEESSYLTPSIANYISRLKWARKDPTKFFPKNCLLRNSLSRYCKKPAIITD